MNQHIDVGIFGEYDPNRSYHVATNDALKHAATALSISLKPSWIPTQPLKNGPIETTLKSFDALLCASVDHKGMNGTLKAIRFAREQGWPFIGT
jgi:CTP synthase (UTP-ammonia lyase)